VQVFGRRDDKPLPALWRPASEKRQGTKSRKVCTVGAAGAMGILPRVRACWGWTAVVDALGFPLRILARAGTDVWIDGGAR
jgi:hypothetical protein